MIHRLVLSALVAMSVAACSSEAAQCQDYIAQTEACYDDHCGASDSSFCECWNDGMDIDLASCDCIPLDLEPICDMIELPATLDCATASATVDNFCNG